MAAEAGGSIQLPVKLQCPMKAAVNRFPNRARWPARGYPRKLTSLGTADAATGWVGYVTTIG